MRIFEMPLRIVRQWIEITSRTAPDAAPSDAARLYYDASADALKVSTNAGSYKTVQALATATAAQLELIGPAFGAVSFDRAEKWAKVALAALDTGGGVLAWQNPEAGSIIITRVIARVTTKSTSASTVDIGTATASAATSSDNLLDGADFGTAAGLFSNLSDGGTNGKMQQELATGKWVTGSKASGACAGLVGSVFIAYLNV